MLARLPIRVLRAKHRLRENGLTSEWNSVRARYLDRKESNVTLQDMKNLPLPNLPHQALQGEPDSLEPAITARRLDTRKSNTGSSIRNSGRERPRMRKLGMVKILPRSKEQRGTTPEGEMTKWQ
jgi:hypothetical protein